MRGTAARSTAAHLFLSRGVTAAEARAASGATASVSGAGSGDSLAARFAGAALRFGAAAATLYVGHDLASDAVFYRLCKRHVRRLAAAL